MLGRLALRCLEVEAGGDGRGGPPPPWIPHDPTIKQREFLALECLEALYGGAAGGGKSDALLMAALAYVDTPGYSAILFRRTYTDLALPGAIMQRAQEWLAGTAARWNDRDKVWIFPSGARLAFGYMDGPRDHFRYKSAEFQFVGFDELTQFEEPQYRYLFSRLRRRGNIDVPLRMRAATNPGDIGHDWVKARFLDAPEDRIFIPARVVDNPHVAQEEYLTSLAQLDPITQQQLRDGAWVRDTTGLVYYSFREAKNRIDALPELPEDEHWCRVLGCDFGVTDPTAFVEIAFTAHDPCVYVTRSDQWTDMSPSDAAEKCIEWRTDAGGYDAIVGDVGGLGKGFEAEWLKRFYLPMRAAKKADKLGYIKLLNGDLHHARVKFLPGNEGLEHDVKTLPWKDETHSKEHPGAPNHRPDAMLYCWREARHWLFEERPPPPKQGMARAVEEARVRKDRVKARIKRHQEGLAGENDEWIWND